MKLEALNQWLSLVASIGVVIGLVLLVVEVNQAIRFAVADAEVSGTEAISAALVEFATSPELAAIEIKELEHGIDALDPIERRRLLAWETSRLMRVESQFIQFEQGFLDEEFIESRFADVVRQRRPVWEALGILEMVRPRVRDAINGVET